MLSHTETFCTMLCFQLSGSPRFYSNITVPQWTKQGLYRHATMSLGWKSLIGAHRALTSAPSIETDAVSRAFSSSISAWLNKCSTGCTGTDSHRKTLETCGKQKSGSQYSWKMGIYSILKYFCLIDVIRVQIRGCSVCDRLAWYQMTQPTVHAPW